MGELMNDAGWQRVRARKGNAQMKHLLASPAALRRRQPSLLVASQVVLLRLPPANHTERATDQSREISPHVWLGIKKPSLEGWITVLSVKFQFGSQRGGGQG